MVFFTNRGIYTAEEWYRYTPAVNGIPLLTARIQIPNQNR
jgi:hypothetical protein